MQSSDPTDKILCILSFAADFSASGQGFEADYSMSFKQLYTNCVCWHASKYGNLDFLGHCGVGNVRYDGLPSWVPDWSDPPLRYSFEHAADPDQLSSWPVYRASGFQVHDLVPTRQLPDTPTVLRLSGARISQVDKVLQPLTIASYSRSLGSLRQLLATSKVSSVKGFSINQIIDRTIVADCRRIFTGDTWISVRIPPKEDFSVNDQNFNPYQLRKTIKGRALFQTKPFFEGGEFLIGIGSQSVESGDQVWLLRGGKLLYHVRPMAVEVKQRSEAAMLDLSSNEDLRGDAEKEKPKPEDLVYRFIGECFILGLMDGKLLDMMNEKREGKRTRLKALDDIDNGWRTIQII